MGKHKNRGKNNSPAANEQQLNFIPLGINAPSAAEIAEQYRAQPSQSRDSAQDRQGQSSTSHTSVESPSAELRQSRDNRHATPTSGGQASSANLASHSSAAANLSMATPAIAEGGNPRGSQALPPSPPKTAYVPKRFGSSTPTTSAATREPLSGKSSKSSKSSNRKKRKDSEAIYFNPPSDEEEEEGEVSSEADEDEEVARAIEQSLLPLQPSSAMAEDEEQAPIALDVDEEEAASEEADQPQKGEKSLTQQQQLKKLPRPLPATLALRRLTSTLEPNDGDIRWRLEKNQEVQDFVQIFLEKPEGDAAYRTATSNTTFDEGLVRRWYHCPYWYAVPGRHGALEWYSIQPADMPWLTVVEAAALEIMISKGTDSVSFANQAKFWPQIARTLTERWLLWEEGRRFPGRDTHHGRYVYSWRAAKDIEQAYSQLYVEAYDPFVIRTSKSELHNLNTFHKQNPHLTLSQAIEQCLDAGVPKADDIVINGNPKFKSAISRTFLWVLYYEQRQAYVRRKGALPANLPFNFAPEAPPLWRSEAQRLQREQALQWTIQNSRPPRSPDTQSYTQSSGDTEEGNAIPHRPTLVSQRSMSSAEATRMAIIYDATGSASDTSSSSTEVREVPPPPVHITVQDLSSPVASAPVASSSAVASTMTAPATPIPTAVSTSSAAAASSHTPVVIYRNEDDKEFFVLELDSSGALRMADILKLETCYQTLQKNGREYLWSLDAHLGVQAKKYLTRVFKARDDPDQTWKLGDFLTEVLPRLKNLVNLTQPIGQSTQPSVHASGLNLVSRIEQIKLDFDFEALVPSVTKFCENLELAISTNQGPVTPSEHINAIKQGFASRCQRSNHPQLPIFGRSVMDLMAKPNTPQTLEALIDALYKVTVDINTSILKISQYGYKVTAPSRPPTSSSNTLAFTMDLIEEPTPPESLNAIREPPPPPQAARDYRGGRQQGRGQGRDNRPSHYGPGGGSPSPVGARRHPPAAAQNPAPARAPKPVQEHTGCQCCNRFVDHNKVWDTKHDTAHCPYRDRHPDANKEGVPWVNSVVGMAFLRNGHKSLPCRYRLAANGGVEEFMIPDLPPLRNPPPPHTGGKRQKLRCKVHEHVYCQFIQPSIDAAMPVEFEPSIEVINNHEEGTIPPTQASSIDEHDREYYALATEYVSATLDQSVNSPDMLYGHVVSDRTSSDQYSLPVTAFLDTGAFSGNYVSKRVADWLLSFGRTKILACEKQICGANAEWCTRCVGIIAIHLKLKSEVSNKDLLLTFQASVLDAAFDIIIGRPYIKEANLVLWFPSHFLIMDDSQRSMLATWVRSCSGCTTLPAGSAGHKTPTPFREPPRDGSIARAPIERTLSLVVKKKEELLTPQNNGEMWIREPRDIDTVLPKSAGVETNPTVDELSQIKIEGSPELQEKLKQLCFKYRALFSSVLLPTPAQVTPMELRVDASKWRIPRNRRPYRPQSSTKESALQKILSKLLANRLIQRSNAEFWSQVLLVPKPEPGDYRLCIDYRALNEASEGEFWPLPVIKQVLERLAHHKPEYYGKMDFTSGFWQTALTEQSRIYTAFITYMGLYEWTRVAMGLKGAPSYFQSRMAFEVLSELLYHCCELYIDDVIVHGQNEENFLFNLEEVFKRLLAKNITLNPKKCHFGMKQTEFVGHVIDKEGRQISSDKIEKVLKFSKPTTIKELRSFLGLVNYFRDHIDHHSDRVRPLFDLLKKASGDDNLSSKKGRCSSKPLSWTRAANLAYDEMVLAVAGAPKLFYLENDERSHPIILKTDASDYGYGAYLYQKLNQVKEQPVAFSSKTFSKEQVRWSTFEKEAYGIYHAVLYFEYLLRDKKFTILTDHKNLTFLNESSSPKVIRWKLELMEYNFDIGHVPGPDNEVADYLSRVKPESEEVEILNLYLNHDPHERLIRIIRDCHSMIWASRPDLDWLAETQCRRDYLLRLSSLTKDLGQTLKLADPNQGHNVLPPELIDPRLHDAPEDIEGPARKKRRSSLSGRGVTWADETLGGNDAQPTASDLQRTNEPNLVVPNPIGDQPEEIPQEVADADLAQAAATQAEEYYNVFRRVHNGVPGHHGVDRTIEKVVAYLAARNQKPWPSMRAHVKQFVKQCPCCQKMSQLKPVIQARPFTTAAYSPWERINIDAVGPLPTTTDGHKYIIVIIDCFTRFVELYPATTVGADDARRAILSCIGRYGVPCQILTDGGSQFQNNTIPEVIRRIGIDHSVTMAYSKEENAMIERANKEVLRHLNAMIYETKIRDDWMDFLPFVQRIINATPHSVTKVAPATLLFGNAIQLDRGIILPFDKIEGRQSTETNISQWIDKMLSKQQELISIATRFQEEHDATNVEKRSKPEYTSFPIGSLVLVAYPITRMGQRAPNKTMTPYKGPMTVLRYEGSQYVVQNLVTMEEESVHISLLKRFEYDDKVTNPFDVATRDNQEFLVDHIVAHRGNFNRKQSLSFRVRWSGYDQDDDTWEPWKGLRLNEKLHDYLRANNLEKYIPKTN